MKLLIPEEAAERLAVSPKTVRDWLRKGKLRGFKVGKLWRIREQDLEAFLAETENATQNRDKQRVNAKEDGRNA